MPIPFRAKHMPTECKISGSLEECGFGAWWVLEYMYIQRFIVDSGSMDPTDHKSH